MSHARFADRCDLPPSEVRAELNRILGSEIFSRSARLSAFLRFIVEQTLSGQGDSLKEHVIAVEVYGRSTDFDTAADPIVRVDARRLRDKLREYYASAPQSDVLVSVPKGSYTPVFAANGVAAGLQPGAVVPLGSAGTGAHGPIAEAAWPRASHWLAIAVALVSIGATTWLVTERRHHSEPAWRQLTVTAFPGSEEDPSLSPDGNFVAFAWKTESEPSLNADIWVKAVEGDALRRLTNTADAYEKHPAWSRDGRYIAFNRTVKGIHSVYLVSSLGGAERLIAGHSRDAVWLPDGQSLILVSTRSYLINGLPQSDSLRRPDRSTLHDFQRRNRPQYRLYSLEIAAETMATKSGHSAVQDIEKLR